MVPASGLPSLTHHREVGLFHLLQQDPQGRQVQDDIVGFLQPCTGRGRGQGCIPAASTGPPSAIGQAAGAARCQGCPPPQNTAASSEGEGQEAAQGPGCVPRDPPPTPEGADSSWRVPSSPSLTFIYTFCRAGQ